MIQTILLTSWWSLKRDKVALLLSFVLPVVFFTIFAMIFGGGGQKGSATPGIPVALVDLDGTDYSKTFAEKLKAEAALAVKTHYQEKDQEVAYTEETARDAVRRGKVSVAILLHKGLRETVGFSMGAPPAVVLVHDPADPRALPTVQGLLQSVAMKANPNIMRDRGMELFKTFGGPLTSQQEWALAMANQTGTSPAGSGEMIPSKVESVVAVAENQDTPNMICYYAAGVGVMFLLFSMSGAGGSLLEEEERGTLDRLLISQLGMNRLILGKWLFFSFSGTAQLCLMFTWAALVFDLPLFTTKHLVSFLVLTIPTAGAAGAFGLLLATLSRSRAQLSGFSTVVILVMSALGGSMIPRFLMPEPMLIAGKFTLNGWAIDGYLKIFWREVESHSIGQALVYLLPEIGAVSLIGALFLTGAFVLARRWKTA